MFVEAGSARAGRVMEAPAGVATSTIRPRWVLSHADQCCLAGLSEGGGGVGWMVSCSSDVVSGRGIQGG